MPTRETISSLIPDEPISAREAREQTQVHHVSTTYEGKEISGNVVMWEFDTRTEADKQQEKETGEKSPVVIFWTGFGLQQAGGDLSTIEQHLIDQGTELGVKRFMFASIRDLPSVGGEVAPNAAASAELMLKVLTPEKLEFDHVHGFPPIEIACYSASGAASISTMARIQEYELKHTDNPGEIPNGKHTLHLTSLTGVGEYATDPKSAKESAGAFAKEVSLIAMETINSQISNVARKRRKTSAENVGDEDLLKQEQTLVEQLTAALDNTADNLRALAKVLRRAASTDLPHMRNLRAELLSLRNKNPDTTKIGRTCNVDIRVPAHDTIQNPGLGADRLLEKKGYILGPYVPWKEEMRLAYERLAFPLANKVNFEQVGIDVKYGDSLARHDHVWKNPEEHFVLKH